MPAKAFVRGDGFTRSSGTLNRSVPIATWHDRRDIPPTQKGLHSTQKNKQAKRGRRRTCKKSLRSYGITGSASSVKWPIYIKHKSSHPPVVSFPLITYGGRTIIIPPFPHFATQHHRLERRRNPSQKEAWSMRKIGCSDRRMTRKTPRPYPHPAPPGTSTKTHCKIDLAS